MFYNVEICYRRCGEKKQVFLQSSNIPKCIDVDLPMLEGLFSLLFYCGINQYAGQETLTDVLGASLLVLELS